MATATVTPEVATKAKRKATPEQKKASQLRRDAAMLVRLSAGSSDPAGMLKQAASLNAQAAVLAPEKAKKEPNAHCAHTYIDGTKCGAKAAKDGTLCFSHSDPSTKLAEDEWIAAEGYFLQDIRPRLLEGFSWRQLKAIAARPA